MVKPATKSWRLLSWLLPIGMYALSWCVPRLVGFQRLGIPWTYYQLLDRPALTEFPLQSLYLLHSQPPLLNGLLALLLQLAEITGVPVEVWAQVAFIALGLVSSILLFRAIADLTDSLVWAAVGILMNLASPAFHFFQHFYFYPFLLQAFLVAFLFFALRALRTGQRSSLWLSALTLALLSNTQSLFHPVWAIAVYALLWLSAYAVHRRSGVFGWQDGVAPSLVLALFLIIWPFKNYALFRQFTFSTWEGYNISRGAGVYPGILWNYLGSGEVPSSIEKEMSGFQRGHGLSDAEMAVIAALQKSNGVRNWNHYIFTKTNDTLKAKTIQAWLKQPDRWMRNALSNYLSWSRPTFIHPYSGDVRGPTNASYIIYAKTLQTLFYYDLQPFLEERFPGLDPGRALYIDDLKLPFTVFGLFSFPLLMLATLVLALRDAHHGRLRNFATILIPWIITLWVLVVPCLTDGKEGNRMRFSCTPCLIFLTIILAKTLVDHLRSRVRRPA